MCHLTARQEPIQYQSRWTKNHWKSLEPSSRLHPLPQDQRATWISQFGINFIYNFDV